ncbi:unnamed protein product, partial [marine sediment metagenome]
CGMAKTYCGKCKYYKVKLICKHPENVRHTTVESHIGFEKKKEYLKKPREINRNNDCPWFKCSYWRL